MSETAAPTHLSPEDMVLRGETYSQFEDLEGLPDDLLVSIADLCDMPEYDTEVCVPCRAMAIYLERAEKRDEEETAEQDGPVEQPQDDEEDRPTPKLDALMAEPAPFLAESQSEIPVVERFANQVGVLSNLVAELLEGPPIPPPNVSQEELAALVIGAERWVKILDAQEIDLSPKQQEIKGYIESVIAKVRRRG